MPSLEANESLDDGSETSMTATNTSVSNGGAPVGGQPKVEDALLYLEHVKEVFAEWEEGSGTRSLSSPDVPIHSQHGSGGANAPAAAARGRGAKKGRRRKRQTGKEDL